MTGCRGVWRTSLLVAFVLWETTASANVARIEPVANDGDGKLSLEQQPRGKHTYSWTGPNALARSALVERQERLQYNCELESSGTDAEALNPDSFRNILVDDSHELLYCYVPKVNDF